MMNYRYFITAIIIAVSATIVQPVFAEEEDPAERPIRTRNERTFEELVKALDDSNRDIRARALWSLAQLEMDELAPEFLKLLDDPSQDIRVGALDALTRLGINSLEVTRVLSLFEESENPEIRRRSLRVVASAGKLDEYDVLADAVEDENVHVRIEAAMLLAEMSPPRAIELASQAIEDDSLRVKRYAILSLADIWEEYGDNDELSPGALSKVESYLKHEEPFLRGAACEAIGAIHARGVLSLLLNMLEDDHYIVRRSASERIGLLRIERDVKVDRATDPLIERLTDVDYTVRESTAIALRDFLPLSAIIHLADRLEDMEPEVREESSKTLAEYRIQDALEAVAAKLLESDMVEARRRAGWVMAEWGDPYGADIAHQALQDEDVFVRAYVLKALRKAGDERAVPHALEALAWENREVRHFDEMRESYVVAYTFNDERFYPLILERLQYGPRWDALEQSDAGPPTSLYDIVGAIDAAGHIGDEEMVKWLERTTGSMSLGEFAKEALARARGEEYVPPDYGTNLDSVDRRTFFITVFDED